MDFYKEKRQNYPVFYFTANQITILLHSFFNTSRSCSIIRSPRRAYKDIYSIPDEPAILIGYAINVNENKVAYT